MQLILAIDADKRQAAQLAALVRGRFDAEFVQATSAGEALQVLAERVPDLIMTSPLLSPFDDGVLAEYLRDHLGGRTCKRCASLSSAWPSQPAVACSHSVANAETSRRRMARSHFFADEIAVVLHGPPRSARQPTYFRNLRPLFLPTQSHTR